MRLRYLHLKNYPPITDIKVCFASSSPLTGKSALRFIVGVNGSGKSNLLRAIAEIFLALANFRVPAFPVSLIYELGVRGSSNHRTLLLHCPSNRQNASLWLHERFAFEELSEVDDFDSCIANIEINNEPSIEGFSALIKPGDWPMQDSSPPLIAIPSAVLVYTTGDMNPWNSVWNRYQQTTGFLDSDDLEFKEERPAGWTEDQEMNYQTTQRESGDLYRKPVVQSESRENNSTKPILIDATLLKCALLAVALKHTSFSSAGVQMQGNIDEESAKPRGYDKHKNTIQELLDVGGSLHLVSIAFRSRMRITLWDQSICKTAQDWWLCASEVIAEPHPFEQRRTLWFDLNGLFEPEVIPFEFSNKTMMQHARTRGQALYALLGGEDNTSSYVLFTNLLYLSQKGLFDDVQLKLRRHSVPENGNYSSKGDIGVLGYEELSDGEQMFMGRVALLHLLNGRDDSLLLLDEPETHFNDLWKRDVVSIVDDALKNTSADVLIATHASLMLTDALKEELLVLERTTSPDDVGTCESSIRILDSKTHTFGATGDHPLRDIFGAPDTVGKRASRLLEVLIAATKYSAEMDKHWNNEEALDVKLIEQIFQTAALTENELTMQQVNDCIDSISRLASYFGIPKPLTMQAVVETFIRQTGPGYFQVELKRAWRRLVERAPDAS